MKIAEGTYVLAMPKELNIPDVSVRYSAYDHQSSGYSIVGVNIATGKVLSQNSYGSQGDFIEAWERIFPQGA